MGASKSTGAEFFLGEMLSVQGQVRNENGNFHDVSSYLWEIKADDASVVSANNNSVVSGGSAIVKELSQELTLKDYISFSQSISGGMDESDTS